MANLSQTPGNVAVGAATTLTKTVQFGEAVTQGQPVYKASDGKYLQCDANDTALKARCEGIVLTPAAQDGYGLIALPGASAGQCTVNLGATLAVGTVYCVSATKGAIAPVGDLTTNDYVTVIGIASTAALLDFQVSISNTQKA